MSDDDLRPYLCTETTTPDGTVTRQDRPDPRPVTVSIVRADTGEVVGQMSPDYSPAVCGNALETALRQRSAPQWKAPVVPVYVRTPVQGADMSRAPAWNCIYYIDGMHYRPGNRCLWCGEEGDRMSPDRLLAEAMASGGTQEWMITAECLAAQNEGREISDGCARTIAVMFAEGMDAGQSFATTGAITDPTEVYRALMYLRGITPIYNTLSPPMRLAADMLGTYLIDAGPRGPVDGWASNWVEK